MGSIIGGIASAAGSIFGGLTSSNASQQAAKAQIEVQKYALRQQRDMFDVTQRNLAPFIKGGGNAFNQLLALIGAAPGTSPLTAPLTKPFAPTMEQLAATPGYQFTLDQGLKAVQSGFAAQGLGGSAAALKGAAGYASGLASTTFQQQFANYWAQNQNIYNMLSGTSTVGANAAANQGSISQQVGANIGNTAAGMGNAMASGIVGSANALTGMFNNLGNLGLMGSATGMFNNIGGQLNSLFGGGGGVDKGFDKMGVPPT